MQEYEDQQRTSSEEVGRALGLETRKAGSSGAKAVWDDVVWKSKGVWGVQRERAREMRWQCS